jgi:hypothetical protein
MKQSIILALVAVANAVDTNAATHQIAFAQISFKYMEYMSKYNKSPATVEEFNMRLANFLKIDAFIQEWNTDLTNTHKVGHNKFSDWTAEEREKLSGLKKVNSKNKRTDVPYHQIDLSNQATATSWNWTAQGVVPNVGNQEQCGDCYAWSAIGAVEASLAIQNNGTNNITGNYTGNYFSVQQITSCSRAYGNDGCNGGWYYWAWEYMQSNPVVQAMYYPFTSGSGAFEFCN